MENTYNDRHIKNEPIKDYAPKSDERDRIKSKLSDMESKAIEIPIIIGGEEIRTGQTEKCIKPHNHSHVLAHYHKAGKNEISKGNISLIPH